MRGGVTKWDLPNIDLKLCGGCGLCVALCPTQALALLNCQAVIAWPSHCTFCDVCENFCPFGAIERSFIVTLAPY
ncbi:MAG: 4Fe-4S binding protein [Chloroflexota bacterium]|jgi:electron transport complex protein RnfB|nr:4Fe-4S binding protein [Chloroflexota bacterium]